MRPLVSVRDATPDDLPDLLAMWRELRDVGSPWERVLPQPTDAAVLGRLNHAQADDDVRIVVASIGEQIVGMVVLTHEPFAALFDARAVHLHYLHVREGHRRRGVGHALVGAGAAYAEEVGAEHVLTSAYPQQRDTQRFYARLGFGPLVVRRVATVPMLRRKLAMERMPSAVDELLARRRSLRSRSRVRQALAQAAGD